MEYNEIDLKVKNVIKQLILLDKAKSAKEIARKSGLDSSVFAQLNAKRSHAKPEWMNALVHTYKVNPVYFFHEDVNLFIDETNNTFENNKHAVQVSGHVGNFIHNVEGDINGTMAKAEKISNQIPPECKDTECNTSISSMKKDINDLKTKCINKEKQLADSLKETKTMNQEVHKMKNKCMEMNEKYIRLNEKYTKLLESKVK